MNNVISIGDHRVAQALQFFTDNAGYSYDPAKETPEQGKIRCARTLLHAEQWYQARDDVEFEWQYDPDIDSSFFIDTPEHEAYPLWQCVMYVGDTAVEVLGGIDLGPDHAEPEYRRVVQAELAAMHTAEEIE
jgi:hypothetical protein